MANQLVKVIAYEGKEEQPLWHATMFFDTARTLCGCYALDEAVNHEAEYKEVQRGGITCTLCLSVIKKIKSIKL